MLKPTARQYICYSFGRKLPDELRDWVLYDLTCKQAVLRHLLRAMVPFTPIYAAMLLVQLGPFWLRGLCVLLALGETTYYSMSFMPMNRQRRLEQHGYPGDLDHVLHRQRSSFDQERYDRTYRQKD